MRSGERLVKGGEATAVVCGECDEVFVGNLSIALDFGQVEVPVR
jgi:hypothetical protein